MAHPGESYPALCPLITHLAPILCHSSPTSKCSPACIPSNMSSRTYSLWVGQQMDHDQLYVRHMQTRSDADVCLLCIRYDLNSFQSGFVVSSSLLGALAGSAAAFVVGDKLGRKREILLGAVLYGACQLPMPAPPSFPFCSLKCSHNYQPLHVHHGCTSALRDAIVCMLTF